MNTLVSFEISRLLKEKGFDVEDRKSYQMYGSQAIPQLEIYNETKLNLYKDYYLAPTIAEVVIWCFNKYKYSIEYSMNIPESGEYDGCYVFNGLIKGSENYKLKIFYTSKEYPTIEKALENTINHFLVNFC